MPIQPTTAIPQHIHSAISKASNQTGASFDYLVNTAKRESSFRTNAKSSSSSASGLFQFVEATWLKVVKEDGPRLGLEDVAKNIRRTSAGHYHVPNSQHRKEILELRNDPEVSALMAAAFTEGNERYVRGRIGRTPSEGELYLAHFLGPGAAAKMIHLSENRPDDPANRYFPAAAKANKPIFYENGQPRSIIEVKELLISSHLGGGSGTRQTRFGPLNFGAGGLMGDMAGTEVSYGNGASGSIGIWGGEQPSNPAPADKKTTASPSKDELGQAELQRHQQAAQQYRAAQASQQQAAEKRPIPDNSSARTNWITDAFGGD